MKEEQDLTAGCRRAEAHRGSAAWARDERSDLVMAGNIERSVLASAIDLDHLVIRVLLTDRVEQRRKRAFFVQGRDDIEIILPLPNKMTPHRTWSRPSGTSRC